jgi:hypothetical protein
MQITATAPVTSAGGVAQFVVSVRPDRQSEIGRLAVLTIRARSSRDDVLLTGTADRVRLSQ